MALKADTGPLQIQGQPGLHNEILAQEKKAACQEDGSASELLAMQAHQQFDP